LAIAAAPTDALDAIGDAALAGATNGAPRRTETVLYVEDNRSNLRLVQRILAKRLQVRLLPAMDGAVGLQLARQHRPALILLDLHLPTMDGEEVLQHLKADPLTAEIPVIVISADATKDRVERVLAGGAEVFLTKPLDVDRFMGLLDVMLDPQVLA
jgi:CheY-like chemotaxis protein